MHLFAAWCKTAYHPGACHIFRPSNFTYIYIYILYTNLPANAMQNNNTSTSSRALPFQSCPFWAVFCSFLLPRSCIFRDMFNFAAVCVKKPADFLAAFPCKGVVGTGCLFRPPPAACGGLRGLRPRVSASPKRAAGGLPPAQSKGPDGASLRRPAR